MTKNMNDNRPKQLPMTALKNLDKDLSRQNNIQNSYKTRTGMISHQQKVLRLNIQLNSHQSDGVLCHHPFV